MHIPPGFLKLHVWIPMSGVSASFVGYALKKTGKELDERRTPVMGVLAAFIFSAQMVNFPVLSGTSGHLIGSTLAVALFGTWPAMVVMTSVVVMQTLLFQDGGLDALGANVFNMSIFGCFISGVVIRVGRKFSSRIFYFSIALAGWMSVTGAAMLCAVELALSSTSPLLIVLPTMTAVHAVIGIFEGIVTVIALRFITAVIPSVIRINAGMVK